MSWDVPLMRNAFLRVQKEIENQLFKKNEFVVPSFFEIGHVEIGFKMPLIPENIKF